MTTIALSTAAATVPTKMLRLLRGAKVTATLDTRATGYGPVTVARLASGWVVTEPATPLPKETSTP